MAHFGAPPRSYAFQCYTSVTVAGQKIAGLAFSPNGDLFVTGYNPQLYPQKVWVARFDTSLILKASTTVPFDSDFSKGIAVDQNGDVFVVGTAGSVFSNSGDIWIGRFDPNLVLRASATLNGAGGYYDYGTDVAMDPDGTLWAAGMVGYNATTYYPWVGKFDRNLVLLSSATHFGASGFATSIIKSNSGNVYASGWTFLTNKNIWLARYDTDLRLVTSVVIDGPGGTDDVAGGVTVDPEGNVVATGRFGEGLGSDLWLGKLQPNLTLISSIVVSNIDPSGINAGLGITADGTGNFFVTGRVELSSFWVGKYDKNLKLKDQFVPGGSLSACVGSSATAKDGALFVTDGGVLRLELDRVTNPAAFAASDIREGSLHWTWQDQQSEDGYRVILGTAANLVESLPADTTHWIEVGLSTNTAHSRRLAAFNSVSASTTSALIVYTLAAPPAAPTMVETFISSFVVAWSSNSNPPETTYRVDVWRSGSATTSITTTDLISVVRGLEFGTTYFWTVAALNGNGRPSISGVVLSTVTNPVAPAAGSVSPSDGGTIRISPPAGDITIRVPPQAFPETVAMTAQIPTTFRQAPSVIPGLRGLGLGVDIVLDRPIQPVRNVTISVSFRDADVAGVDKDRLLLARLDELRGIWVPLLSTRDAANNSVTAQTGHLSTFQLMVVTPAATPFAARAFPNPLRPARGDAAITFANLPAGARLRVYTVSSELVADFSSDATGMARWDGKNTSGARVSSGVYLVYIQGAGQSNVMKVAVQR